MTAPTDVVSLLLATPGTQTECPGFEVWIPIWRAGQASHGAGGCFTAAVACALKADRVAWAFICGYQGAIQATFQTAVGTLGAFGANEAQRKITEVESSLDQQGGQLLLVGSKSWVLAGIDDLTVFVLCRYKNGPAKGPGSLCIVKVPIRSVGVESGPPRAQTVVPELPHSGLQFQSAPVAAADVLPGDGYADYAKPFRLREDDFVTGSVLAYLIGESETGGWSTAWTQRAMAAVALQEVCSRRDPRPADSIILVAGALSFAGEVVRDADEQWGPRQAVARERWLRDKPILSLGKDARRRRALQSWRAHGRMADEAVQR